MSRAGRAGAVALALLPVVEPLARLISRWLGKRETVPTAEQRDRAAREAVEAIDAAERRRRASK